MSTCNGDQFVNGYVNRVAQWPALRRPRPAFAFWQITIKNSFFLPETIYQQIFLSTTGAPRGGLLRGRCRAAKALHNGRCRRQIRPLAARRTLRKPLHARLQALTSQDRKSTRLNSSHLVIS